MPSDCLLAECAVFVVTVPARMGVLKIGVTLPTFVLNEFPMLPVKKPTPLAYTSANHFWFRAIPKATRASVTKQFPYSDESWLCPPTFQVPPSPLNPHPVSPVLDCEMTMTPFKYALSDAPSYV